MKKVYILLSLAILFSGCTTSIPKITKYKISSNVNVNKQINSTCKSKSIKVSSAFTSSSLMSKDMSYVQGDSKVFEYSESAWLNNPNRAVSRELMKMLRDINVYKSVQDSKSRSIADLIVESTLEEFTQYYTTDLDKSYALVQINFSIIEAKTNKVLSAKTFKSKVKSKTLDAEGGVEALNVALNTLLKESSIWFIQGCK